MRLIDDEDEPAIAVITVAELGVGVEIASANARRLGSGSSTRWSRRVPIVGYDLDVARAHTSLLVAVRRAEHHAVRTT